MIDLSYISAGVTDLSVCRLHHPKIPIVHLPSQKGSTATDPTQESQSISKRAQELQSSWRTIKQLKDLNPFELQVRWCSSHLCDANLTDFIHSTALCFGGLLQKNARFLCRASIVDINCTSGWCYLGCLDCRQSIRGSSS